MNDFIEAVVDSVASKDTDNTVYLPDSYARAAEQAQEEPEEDEDAKLTDETQRPRRDLSMPIHRSGNKRDIFGLYGRKKLEELARKRREAKKKD